VGDAPNSHRHSVASGQGVVVDNRADGNRADDDQGVDTLGDGDLVADGLADGPVA